MPTNGDTEAARAYHGRTKHSPLSIRTGGHFLDWPNKPHPFKVYEDLEPVALPRTFSPPSLPTLEALGGRGGEGKSLDLETLAQVLYFSAGITKTASLSGGGTLHFRAAACAGALYPIELYVISGDVNGLEAGVYHYTPLPFGLTQLRKGDYRATIRNAVEEAEEVPTVYLALSGIFWRSAWKYQTRAYRYCFWDSGTILANLLATASAASLPAQILMGFVDRDVNALLGLDGHREAALCVVPLGDRGPSAPSPAARAISPPVRPLSASEVEYPEIHTFHAASTLASAGEVQEWRGSLPRRRPDPEDVAALSPVEEKGLPLGETILRRGSTRRFRHASIRKAQLSAILQAATPGVPADFTTGPQTILVDLYVIVNAVEGVDSGAYVFSPTTPGLTLLQAGKFRAEAGYLCLEQSLGVDASAVVFLLADLDQVLARFGNRGYRAAQLEAGIVGGRLYLAAYALGLGATGLTFYDDEVVNFFAPHAAGKDALFIVALGRAGRVESAVQPVALTRPLPAEKG